MIVANSVEFSLPTGRFRASARYISILRPEAETFSNRIARSDREFWISPRHIIFNLLTGIWYFLPELNCVFPQESSKLLLWRSQFSGRKLNLSQEEWHSPIGCWECLSQIFIASYSRKVIVSTSFELTLSNRKFQSSAWWNSILSPEDQSLPRRIAYSLTRKLEITPSQVIFALPAGRW